MSCAQSQVSESRQKGGTQSRSRSRSMPTCVRDATLTPYFEKHARGADFLFYCHIPSIIPSLHSAKKLVKAIYMFSKSKSLNNGLPL